MGDNLSHTHTHTHTLSCTITVTVKSDTDWAGVLSLIALLFSEVYFDCSFSVLSFALWRWDAGHGSSSPGRGKTGRAQDRSCVTSQTSNYISDLIIDYQMKNNIYLDWLSSCRAVVPMWALQDCPYGICRSRSFTLLYHYHASSLFLFNEARSPHNSHYF